MLPGRRRGVTATSPRFLCFGPMRARAPLRIDLAGGWSDIPPFARPEGGGSGRVGRGVTPCRRRDDVRCRRSRGALPARPSVGYGLGLVGLVDRGVAGVD